MLRFFKNCELDLFAIPITLNRGGRKKANSRHGMLITIIFVGFILWFIYSTGREMFVKESPNTISYDSFQEIPPPIQITPDSFPFAFGLQLPTSLGLNFFKDEGIYRPEVQLAVIKLVKESDGSINKELEFIELEMETCTFDHFGESWRSFTNAPLESLYCLKPIDKLVIEGIEDISDYQGFRVGVKMCNNTAEISCKSDDEIKAKLTGAWTNLLYLQSAINPQNFTHPNQRFMSSMVSFVTPNVAKNAIIKLNHLNVFSDDGWLFEDKKVQNFIKVNSPVEYFDLEPDAEGFLWRGLFEMGQVVTTYERRYTRIQTILAQIQGSAATIILALIIILQPYSQIKFNETLINELFEVKMKKEESPMKKKKERRSQKTKEKHKREGQEDVMDEKEKPAETIGFTERGLMTIRSKQEEEKSPDPEPERGLTENKLASVQSFKTLFTSLENENESPEVPYYQKPIRTLFDSKKIQQKNQAKPSKKSNKLTGLLTVEKPGRIKLAALSDVISDAPDSPKKTPDITPKNENKEEIENHSPIIPPLSPSHEPEKQGFVSLDLIDLKENGEKEGSKEEFSEEKEGPEEINSDSNYESSKIDISIWEFFLSFVKKSKRTKEKFDVLDKGMKHVRERMDILNIMKKFRELDKLKTLLLEEDQLVLFNAIPKAEIAAGGEAAVASTGLESEDLAMTSSFSRRILKKSTFIEIDKEKEQVEKAYNNIRMKMKKSKIDSRLLELYQ